MPDRDYHDFGGLDEVNQAVGKTPEEHATRLVNMRRPSMRMREDELGGVIKIMKKRSAEILGLASVVSDSFEVLCLGRPKKPDSQRPTIFRALAITASAGTASIAPRL